MEYRPNIIKSDNQAFEDIIYGAPSRELSKYLSEKMSVVSNFITEKTRSFFNRSKELYNEMSSERARKRISDRIMVNNVSLSSNSISLITRENYSAHLGNYNRRYLMANPELYNLNKKKRISGFNGAYENVDKHVEDPYWKRDYLRASSGLLRKVDNNNDSIQFITTVRDEFNDLAFSEQVMIKRNWSAANRLLVDDIDITELVD